MPLKNSLIISSSVMLIFCINYLLSPEYAKYTGPYPFGIISGITFLTQAVMLILTIRNAVKTGWDGKKLFVTVLEIAFILINGYFLLIWYIIVKFML